MFVYLHQSLGKPTNLAYVDSTILTVCHIARASSHKVFKNMARKGKTTTGWFFGFKLHVVINHKAEIIGFMLTPGNVDDRRPVHKLTKTLLPTAVTSASSYSAISLSGVCSFWPSLGGT